MNILFVSDGSISNPILHSQGIPLLNNLTENSCKVWMITFEVTSEFKLREKYELETKFKWIPILMRKNIFFSHWFGQLLKKTYSINNIVRKFDIEIVHTRSFFPSLYVFSY